MTLSRQIEAELQSFASRGEMPSYRLTLTAIAEYFNASIQPVRTAVDALLKGAWLLRDDRRQLILNPAKKGVEVLLASTVASSQSDAETALTQMVIRISLRGESVFLREEESAEQLGVGRTVIRSILGRLSGRGLVEHMPRRGWRVCAFSKARMEEYIQMRELLEIHALEMSADRLDPMKLERLLERNKLEKSGRIRIDNSLHSYWIEAAGNRYITEFFAQHGQYYATLFDYATLKISVLSEMAEQHREILKYLLDFDVGRASAALHAHIQSQRPNVHYFMERYQTASV